MRTRSLSKISIALVAPSLWACSLITSLDGLQPDASMDAGTDSPVDVSVPGDAGDAGVATDAGDATVPPGVFTSIHAGGSQAFSASGAHVCAVGGIERALYCWGANDHGQLGLGSTGNGTASADKSTPTKIATNSASQAFTAVDEFALGAWHTCARVASQLYCWGQRVSGAVGDGTFGADQTSPLNVMNFATPNVALGMGHTCMIGGKFGNLLCWGLNHSEQLGHALATANDVPCTPFFDTNAECAPTSSVAIINTAALAISAGTLHTCAIVANGQVQCWGYNGERATGAQGNVAISTPTPITVQTSPNVPLTGVTQLSSTGRHNCVVQMPGNTVWCWGQNDAGQAGQPPINGFPLATQVPNVVASVVAVGERATCAVLTPSTEVVCWGDDTFGQLGDGTKQSTFTPVAVKGPDGVGKLSQVTSLALAYGFACALTADDNVWCWGHNDRGQLGDGTTTDRPYPVRVIVM